MYEADHFLNVLLEHSVSRWVGDLLRVSSGAHEEVATEEANQSTYHEGSEPLLVLLNLRLKIGNVHVAMLVALHNHDLHPGHNRAGGIGAVGRNGDETDIPVALANILKVIADAHQTSVFALGSRLLTILQGISG